MESLILRVQWLPSLILFVENNPRYNINLLTSTFIST